MLLVVPLSFPLRSAPFSKFSYWSGSAVNTPAGPGSPTAKCFLVHFELKINHFLVSQLELTLYGNKQKFFGNY